MFGEQILAQGISDTVNFFTGRREDRHDEAREDRFRVQDREWFRKDRRHAEEFARQFRDTELLSRVRQASKSGIHPLAALGMSPSSGPAFTASQQPSSYPGSQPNFRMTPIDISALKLNEAQTRLLNSQANLFDEQAKDSAIARAVQQSTPDKLVEDILPPNRTTHVNVAGMPVRSSPGFSDAQSYEDRYGELGGSIIGLGNIPADIIYSIYRGIIDSKPQGYSKDDPVFSTFE